MFTFSTMGAVMCCCLLLCPVWANECHFVTQRVQCGKLTCNDTSGRCVPCTQDSDCYETPMGCFDGECKLRSLEDSFKPVYVLAPIGTFIVSAVAVIAGVGGGGILVPLFAFTMDFPLAYAVALSQAAIVGHSTVNVIVLLHRRHPHYAEKGGPQRPIINYEYLALMLPFSLVGTMIGGALSKISPDWLRVVLLFALLSYVLYRVILRIKKQQAHDKAEIAANECLSPTSPLLTRRAFPDPEKPKPEDGVNEDEVTEVEGSKPQYPLKWFAFMTFIFGTQLTFNIIHEPEMNIIQCGSVAFVVVYVVAIIFNVTTSLSMRAYFASLLRKVKNGELGEEVVPFAWNTKTTIIFPILSLTAGAGASMLGIGGGLILSFLLSETGMTPEEVSATGGFTTFLVSTMAATAFYIAGLLRLDYALMMFCIGGAATLVGQFIFMREIKRRKWRFLIYVSLGVIMGASMLFLGILGIVNTINIVHHGGSLGFGKSCDR